MKKLCFAAFLSLLCNIVISCNNAKEALQPAAQQTIVEQPKKEPRNISDYDATGHKIDFSKYLTSEDLRAYTVAAPKVGHIKKLKPPFDTLQFNKVIAYKYDGSEEPYGSIIINDKFVPVVLKQQYLNTAQIKNLLGIITSTSTYGGAMAGCFNPRLGILFYKDDAIVYKIDICLECGKLGATTAIPASEFYKVNAGTEDEYVINGFSEKGHDQLEQFSKAIGF